MNITGIDVNSVISSHVTYIGNGTYMITYTPSTPGSYSITIGSAYPYGVISPTPTLITVQRGVIEEPDTICASCSEIFGVGSGLASALTTNSFFIRTKDCFGGPLLTGGANFTILFSFDGTAF